MNVDLTALQKLTPQERQLLIEGISPQAAIILKKIFPDNAAIDMLTRMKTGFSNF
jgi:hypothetical protein